MLLTELPLPRQYPDAWQPFAWPTSRTIRLLAQAPPPSVSFRDVAEYRRSERSGAAPNLRQVLDVLRFATSFRDTWVYDGIDRYRAPPISAGGLHGIDLIVLPANAKRLLLFTRQSTAVKVLRITNSHRLAQLREQANDCIPGFPATMVVLAADLAKYSATYFNPESLIWRDSGALQQMIAMTAFAFGFAACPLGLHGDAVIDALDAPKERLAACGAIVIGRYAPSI